MDNNIDLHVIDISHIHHMKENESLFFLGIIEDIINKQFMGC
jgi:hypothetical protein